VSGTPLNQSNIYNRVLHPALQTAGIAVKVGEKKWDYQHRTPADCRKREWLELRESRLRKRQPQTAATPWTDS